MIEIIFTRLPLVPIEFKMSNCFCYNDLNLNDLYLIIFCDKIKN